ncbi:glycosyl hydrolase family 76-domain-containing protein [Podospora didyma]|uniref:Mannan endo-1,6-alpha-mannosidase n=1 Tax=Podospora didyma TaxID=330526 RepID=A0AAE0NR08_9PEZI|nr:glycosyl hydrolase family 76-domain-containing protein [Podospora didyma]
MMATSLASMAPKALLLLGFGLGSLPATTAQRHSPYQIDTREHIVESARTLAYDLMTYYKGNQTGKIPGLLPGPPTSKQGDYWWWQGGALMATFVDYWKLTGDNSYNQVVTEGLLWQAGEDGDFQPLNQTATMGNDEQCFWANTAMLAAENGFPNPPQGKPQWIDLSKTVFEYMTRRRSLEKTCGGDGLRWQIPLINAGYDYKNTVSNACYFNLAARLALYTGNSTYSDAATSVFKWLEDVGFVTKDFAVYDGAHTGTNCTDINKAQFSLNAAYLTEGAAFMYNATNGQNTLWKDRLSGLTTATLSTFFPKDVATEIACESRSTCTTDMLMYKGFLHSWLSVAAKLAPQHAAKILGVLNTSATAAVYQCLGGPEGTTKRQCGFYWSKGSFYTPPGTSSTGTGAGEQMNVLNAVQSLLMEGSGKLATQASPAIDGSGGKSSSADTTGTSTSSTTSAAPTSDASRETRSVGVVVALVSGLGLFMGLLMS